MTTTAEERAATKHSGVNGKPCSCWNDRLIADLEAAEREKLEVEQEVTEAAAFAKDIILQLERERDDAIATLHNMQSLVTEAERDTLQAQLTEVLGRVRTHAYPISGTGCRDCAAYLTKHDGGKP